ncbi:MAG: cytochrome c oxidase subunit II [Chloroflexota bacterium]
MLHFIIVGVLVIAMSILTYLGLTGIGLLPVQASAQAIPIDWMFDYQIMAMSFLFSLIVVPLIYSLIVFRRRKGDTTDAEHIEGNTPLEIIWTVIPLFAVITFAFMGAKSLGDTRRVDPQAMVINVTAQQFAFSFEYPDYGFTSKELYAPVNKQLLLKMTSLDVIHSFWVPEFRVKQDIVPGRFTEYRITPILEGVYKVRCAEVCGGGHAGMQSFVEIVSQGRFDDWVKEKQAEALAASQTPEDRGKLLSTSFGCFGCHSVDGSLLPNGGPSWLGLFGSETELEDGSTVLVDEAYITQSIMDPASQVVKGFSPMTFNGTDAGLTEADLADIIAYIKTLQ